MKRHAVRLGSILLAATLAFGGVSYAQEEVPNPALGQGESPVEVTGQNAPVANVEAPANETPATETPTAEAPENENPVTEAPAAETPATENPAADALDQTAAPLVVETQDAKGEEKTEPQVVEKTEGEDELVSQATKVASVRYRTHVQRIGWQNWFTNGEVAGTSGDSLRVEAFRIGLLDANKNAVNGISYQTHVQGIGWQDWVSDGALSGTEGASRRVEGIRIKLSDELAAEYDVWYRVHIQRHGWLGWASNGESAGSQGSSLRMEAVRVIVLPKGQKPSDFDGTDPFVAFIAFEGHVQRIGWVKGDNSVGTVGQSLRIEGIRARLAGTKYDGSVIYSAHVQHIGWQNEVSDGKLAGTTGQSRRVEAITMRLEGEVSKHYDVWYRLHVQTYGWLGWVKNGAQAGTEGLSRRTESIQVQLLPKNVAPSNGGSTTDDGFLTLEDVQVTSGQPLSQANANQRRLVQSAYSTPSAPAGYCAQWVEDVYANAGFGMFMGDACDLYDMYCHSSNLADLKAGMIVAVSTHPHSTAGSIWGHVGVFVGDDTVRDSVFGYVRTSSLQEWMSYYGATVPVKWGWLGNVNVA